MISIRMKNSAATFQSVLNKLVQQAPVHIDLRDEVSGKMAFDFAKEILDLYPERNTLLKLEESFYKTFGKNNQAILVALAIKLALSKFTIANVNKPIQISVVLAMYKEHNRILPNSIHPHGEDFLRRKIYELAWLFNQNDLCSWELILVDDGCPHRSGQIAQNIITTENISEQARVLYLDSAIKKSLIPVKNLRNTKESQKGGSIIYGMWYATQRSKLDDHIILFTDADLSTHLGQIGILIEPLINNTSLVSIGSRRETNSALLKKGKRNHRGKLFIYLWKQLIPSLDQIIDTQCGFKAFKKDLLDQILHGLSEMKFAFDIELLLKSELLHENCINKVPIAWIDSEEASTTTDLQPYLTMLKSIVNMYKKYIPPNERSDTFAKFIMGLDKSKFNHLLDHIPKAIQDCPAEYLGRLEHLSVEDFKI